MTFDLSSIKTQKALVSGRWWLNIQYKIVFQWNSLITQFVRLCF